MNLIVLLIQKLKENQRIRKGVLFVVHSSFYKIGNKIRFVERAFKNSNVSHLLIELEWSEYIETIITFSREKKSIKKITVEIKRV